MAETALVIGPDGLGRPAWATSSELLRNYYDTEWGIPVTTEQGLFERLTLEVFQAGLSWEIILRKRPAFRAAFHNFDVDAVAAFGPTEVAELLQNSEIVRNRAKIHATINNAQATARMRDTGGLAELIWSHKPGQNYYPRTLADIPTQSPESACLARTLKQHGFKFVGPTTMFALMEAIGVVDTHLLGSHRRRHSARLP